MGHHFVPKHHLKRFEIDQEPNTIWMYDKKTGKFADLAIPAVAQAPEFYSEEVEKALSEVIEGPANHCIEKLLNPNEELTNADRTQLSLYMLIMATRGPKLRKKSMAKAPEILSDIFDETKEQLRNLECHDEETREVVNSRLSELEQVREKFITEIPEQVVEQIRTPFWSEHIVELLHNMAWHLVPSPASMFYVTSDTPAHFFEGLGLGNQDSEFAFPISSNLALVGEHHRSFGRLFEQPNARAVKECNRRIISNADRFVFSPKKADWIDVIAQKTNHHFNAIRWP